MENNIEILNKLQSGDSGLMAEAIQAIQENGDLSIAESLLTTLPNIKDQRLETVIINLLADIKAKDFSDLVIRQIMETTDSSLKNQLLRIVWESSLDYSAHLELFLRMLQEEEFPIAFEASTVIENMVHHLTPAQRKYLHSIICAFPEEKQFLIENIHEELECPDEE